MLQKQGTGDSSMCTAPMAEPSLLRMQKHYIPVSWHDFESDLQLKLTWARNNDAKAKQIMLAGKEYAEKHLNDRFLTWYQEQVLLALAGGGRCRRVSMLDCASSVDWLCVDWLCVD